MKQAEFDLICVETAGIGQSDNAITQLADISVYVMTSEYGAPSQLEKIEMLDYADFVVINKFTHRGSKDALRDVRKQIQRNRQLFDTPVEELMVFATSAAHFNDAGVNALYAHLIDSLNRRHGLGWESRYPATEARVTDTGPTHHPGEPRALPQRDLRCVPRIPVLGAPAGRRRFGPRRVAAIHSGVGRSGERGAPSVRRRRHRQGRWGPDRPDGGIQPDAGSVGSGVRRSAGPVEVVGGELPRPHVHI